MKKLIISGMFVTSLALFTHAQTVDEIINKHIAAMGGKEKTMSLKTVKMTGKTIPVGVQAKETPVVFLKKHMTGFRIERSADGKNWTVITPTKGWGMSPGKTSPTELPEDITSMQQKEFDLHGQFINCKEKGTKIELNGKGKINSSDCFILMLTYKDGKKANYYIDSKTYRIYRRTFQAIGDITYSDYKQNANGYWFPYTETGTNSGGKRVFTKIETNIAVDDKIFQVDEGVF